MSPELCRFTRCDWRIPKYPSGNSSADIEILYKKSFTYNTRELHSKRLEKCAQIVVAKWHKLGTADAGEEKAVS